MSSSPSVMSNTQIRNNYFYINNSPVRRLKPLHALARRPPKPVDNVNCSKSFLISCQRLFIHDSATVMSIEYFTNRVNVQAILSQDTRLTTDRGVFAEF